ncbi:glycosyltransferase family 32 protein [Dermatophilus congolensis]|uniref:glycosyltransferase family 32 protein n=1 Tax=Dermatophilus congolensis TaxID=1863 RepID=UPI001AAE2209|nr:glycosyltransferase [Dermatophilus congolensis]MBO3143426.1 hypothetical protein [Dermatophilus congolensis]MBO3152416.1 hypothetical protein [Dermatophilus congolensis]MBO3160573.1 hypothetical protein [Dermatophilus congolensis]MBO3163703.1 hypothetical protein [Dermatophilus congolensis]MBO3177249.1 hypothetical protein [Dermatophilus congolensis]
MTSTTPDTAWPNNLEKHTRHGDELRIPRKIHFFWAGSNELPEFEQTMIASWKKWHPSWEITIWTPETLTWMKNYNLLDKVSSFSEMSDLARYEILYRHGGIYIDTDFECYSSFESTLTGIEGAFSAENGTTLGTAFCAFTPHHPFLNKLIDAMAHAVTTYPNAPANIKTGPGLVTQVAENSPEFSTVTVFPPDLVFPYLYNEISRRGDRPSHQTLAAHHWSGSWSNSSIPQVCPYFNLTLHIPNNLPTEERQPALSAVLTLAAHTLSQPRFLNISIKCEEKIETENLPHEFHTISWATPGNTEKTLPGFTCEATITPEESPKAPFNNIKTLFKIWEEITEKFGRPAIALGRGIQPHNPTIHIPWPTHLTTPTSNESTTEKQKEKLQIEITCDSKTTLPAAAAIRMLSETPITGNIKIIYTDTEETRNHLKETLPTTEKLSFTWHTQPPTNENQPDIALNFTDPEEDYVQTLLEWREFLATQTTPPTN